MATRMSPKQVRDLIIEVIGEDVLVVVDFLKNKKDISEFQIAEKIKLEVNAIRNILYRLNNHDLVTYIRRKDRIKGWYISYWTLNLKGAKHLRDKVNKERLEKLKERLDNEIKNRNSFFMCSSMCARVDFDTATDLGYRCPECGELLNQQDNSKTIENLQKRIAELESATS